MKRIDLLLNKLDSTFDKESWYAPFKHAIEGLTAEQAMWKPAGETTNTIWENVNHLTYYKQNSLEGKLLDIMLHDAYHTGQIIQLRKMQGAWPSKR